MENASKALIIAGAILISILLISVGIMVMNSTGEVQEGMESEMGSTAIQQFNSKFQSYMGTRTATEVKSLMSVVTASNASSSHQMVYSGTINSPAQLNTRFNYTVTITDTNADGYLDQITINQNGGSPVPVTT